LGLTGVYTYINLKAEVAAIYGHCGSGPASGHLPALSAAGGLDIRQVLSSPYFFA
jgi:hypothetical protein